MFVLASYNSFFFFEIAMAENLSPIVMKFGGTSLRDESSRESALTHINATLKLVKRLLLWFQLWVGKESLIQLIRSLTC